MEKEIIVKKRVNYAKIFIAIIVLYVIGLYMYKIVASPIKNIYIKNNKYLIDQEVIDSAGLRNYPSFFLTPKYKIKKRLYKNEMIKNVKIEKKLGNKVIITILENDPLFIKDDKVILSNGKKTDKMFELPYLEGKITDEILDKLIEKYETVNDEIKIMISEIKYDPNNIDKERFLIIMNDGNYVYITLYKMSSINEYIKILSTLDNKKGIIYLDSGNYFEEFK